MDVTATSGPDFLYFADKVAAHENSIKAMTNIFPHASCIEEYNACLKHFAATETDLDHIQDAIEARTCAETAKQQHLWAIKTWEHTMQPYVQFLHDVRDYKLLFGMHFENMRSTFQIHERCVAWWIPSTGRIEATSSQIPSTLPFISSLAYCFAYDGSAPTPCTGENMLDTRDYDDTTMDRLCEKVVKKAKKGEENVTENTCENSQEDVTEDICENSEDICEIGEEDSTEDTGDTSPALITSSVETSSSLHATSSVRASSSVKADNDVSMQHCTISEFRNNGFNCNDMLIHMKINSKITSEMEKKKPSVLQDVVTTETTEMKESAGLNSRTVLSGGANFFQDTAEIKEWIQDVLKKTGHGNVLETKEGCIFYVTKAKDTLKEISDQLRPTYPRIFSYMKMQQKNQALYAPIMDWVCACYEGQTRSFRIRDWGGVTTHWNTKLPGGLLLQVQSSISKETAAAALQSLVQSPAAALKSINEVRAPRATLSMLADIALSGK